MEFDTEEVILVQKVSTRRNTKWRAFEIERVRKSSNFLFSIYGKRGIRLSGLKIMLLNFA